MSSKHPVAFLALLLTAMVLAASALAQTEHVIYSFQGGTDGARPTSGLISDSAGNLYGTTYYGGDGTCSDSFATGCGIVFELSPQITGGYSKRTLHQFRNDGIDGTYPVAGLVLDAAGNLYGTTAYGGRGVCSPTAPTGCGVVFRLSRTKLGGWAETILHSFVGGSDGQRPVATLVRDSAGHFFGTTSGDRGSCEHGFGVCGTVFELSRTQGHWMEQVIHSFTYNSIDGYAPDGSVVLDNAGNVYGGTRWGGVYFDGVAYKLSSNANGSWIEDIPFNTFFWKGLNGGGPSQYALDSNGNLIGVSSTGGTTYSGELLELSPASSGPWTETALFDFEDNGYETGVQPNARLVSDPAGNLYGTTQGFVSLKGEVPGTVVKLTP